MVCILCHTDNNNRTTIPNTAMTQKPPATPSVTGVEIAIRIYNKRGVKKSQNSVKPVKSPLNQLSKSHTVVPPAPHTPNTYRYNNTQKLKLLLLGLLTQLLLPSNHRRMTHGLLPPKRLKRLMESPLHSILNRLVKQRRQKRHNRQSQSNRPPRTNSRILDILHRPSRIPHHAVDRKRRESHTR